MKISLRPESRKKKKPDFSYQTFTFLALLKPFLTVVIFFDGHSYVIIKKLTFQRRGWGSRTTIFGLNMMIIISMALDIGNSWAIAAHRAGVMFFFTGSHPILTSTFLASLIIPLRSINMGNSIHHTFYKNKTGIIKLMMIIFDNQSKFLTIAHCPPFGFK